MCPKAVLSSKAKTLTLTVDYELFFGDDSGTVENSMIRPTRKLIRLMKRYNGKMTLFWDILHYYRLTQLANECPDLMLDKQLIESQIIQLIQDGHDVQMHLHPHWLDAIWEGHRWRFSYQRYALHQLSHINDPSDIQTIIGCMTIARQLMETVCRQADPSYKVTAFRAPGCKVEPFVSLRDAMLYNQIHVDVSGCYGIKRTHSFIPFDYTQMPIHPWFRFNQSILQEDPAGPFIELPIETIRLSCWKKWWLENKKRINYIYPGRYGDGKGLGEKMVFEKKDFFSRFKRCYVYLSPEESFPEEWEYLTGKARDMGVVIMQPKNMSPFTYTMIEDSLMKGRVRFISIKERLTALGI